MARMLSQLLGANQAMLTLTIQELEGATGHPGADVHLMAAILQTLRQKTAELGLDPQDTTNEELYAALLDKIAHHNERLMMELELTRSSLAHEVLDAVVKAVDRTPVPRSCWALKRSVLKQLLKANPPKTTMKLLGYKSIDSLLKRERAEVVVAVAQYLESRSWQHAYAGAYRMLRAADFEQRLAVIIVLESKRWQKVAARYLTKQANNLVVMREAGVIALLPLPTRRLPGLAITELTLVLKALAEVRSFSSYAKLHQMTADFGEVLVNGLRETPSVFSIATQAIPWAIMHRYFSSRADHHPELFEPHVQAEDLAWRQVEAVLADILPELSFWQGLHYVGSAQEDSVVSFNVIDMAINNCNQLPYGHQTSYYLQASLWDELLFNYFDQAPVQATLSDQLVQQLPELAEAESPSSQLMEVWNS